MGGDSEGRVQRAMVFAQPTGNHRSLPDFSQPNPMLAAPLRIALLTYATKPRGSVIHTLELADALHQLGHSVCIYALDKDGRGFDRPVACDYHLVPARPVPASDPALAAASDPAPAPDSTDRLIQQRIQEFVDYLSQPSSQSPRLHDIYHAQDCISANALVLLRQQIPIPHIVRTVHHIEDYNSTYLQQCQDSSICAADLCLCISQHWQTEVLQQYGISAPRVLNGINTDRFSATSTGAELLLKQRWGLSGQPLYLTVGGIEPRKNSIALLHAFQRVLRHYPQAQLAIAGGATLFDYQPYRDQFFALAEQLGIKIGTSLILPGVIAEADLPALYRTANAFVFPSLKEGWGLVVLEAIASGLPVITADQPPFTEFLTPAQALLVDPRDPAAIAQAMLNVVHPAIAQSLIQQSQSICQRYTWHRSAQLHVEQYEKLMLKEKE